VLFCQPFQKKNNEPKNKKLKTKTQKPKNMKTKKKRDGTPQGGE
jgi:hypothetical protein